MKFAFSALKLFVFSVICFCFNSEPSNSHGSKKVSSETKFKQILELSHRGRNSVINLDEVTYPYYAIDLPRPYTLMVFLTAAHPKFKCAVCKQMDKDFETMAKSYSNDVKSKGETPSIFFLRLGIIIFFCFFAFLLFCFFAFLLFEIPKDICLKFLLFLFRL